uniref:Uncharacterized protein n=1 Tax=Aegilops tauschii TaxID=37682 RepID=M8C073_AEGTA
MGQMWLRILATSTLCASPDECCHEWVLKGEYNLKRLQTSYQHAHGPWVLEDINYGLFSSQLPLVKKKAAVEEKAEWNSDDDSVDDNVDVVQECNHACDILGFHPFKEIMFMSSFTKETWVATVHTFHLNSSSVECIGNMSRAKYDVFELMTRSDQEYKYFPYTHVGSYRLQRK